MFIVETRHHGKDGEIDVMIPNAIAAEDGGSLPP